MNLSLTPEQAEAWSLATRGPWPRVDGSASDPDWMALALQEAIRGVGLSVMGLISKQVNLMPR